MVPWGDASCEGCRFCEWLPAATKATDGCPAREVMQAVTRARKRKRERQGDDTRRSLAPSSGGGSGEEEGEGDGERGFEMFCEEYHPSVVAVAPQLVSRAGGAQLILLHMWGALAPSRREGYDSFAAAQSAGKDAARPAALPVHGPPIVCCSLVDVHYYPTHEHWAKLGPLFESRAARGLWLPEVSAP
jgi:hypothetical protein